MRTRQRTHLKTLSWRFLNIAAVFALAMPSPSILAKGSPSPDEGTGSRRFRLVFTSRPDRQAILGWESVAGDHTQTHVHFGRTDFGTNKDRYERVKRVERLDSYKGMVNAFVTLDRLEADTVYYFVVASDKGVSRRFWFKTAPDQAKKMSFIAGGDSRNNRVPRRNANLLVSKLKPTAVFFAGDFTASGSNSQWQEWFDDWQLTITSSGRMIPIVPGRGNHESSDEILHRLFQIPASNYFSSEFGPVLKAFSLNSETSIGGQQRQWLENELQDSRNAWKLAFYHRPIRPHSKNKPEGNAQYQYWAPLFYRFGMNLVVEADAHTVKQTWPIRPATGAGSHEGFVRDNARGTVYVGEGGWGAPLRSANDIKSWTRDSGSFNHFNWIFVDTRSLELRTIVSDNAESVAELADSAPFVMPKNIAIWNPKNGAVIRMTK